MAAEKNISKKITRIKAQSAFGSVVWFVVLVYIFRLISENPVQTVLLFVCGLVGAGVLGVIHNMRIARLVCPNCGKPILTKSRAFDQTLVLEKSYEKCYFCSHIIS